MWTKRERKKPTPNYAIHSSARKAMNEGRGEGNKLLSDCKRRRRRPEWGWAWELETSFQ